jgi:uncharacterized protein
MSQPFKLYRLQQIDSQLDGMRARLKEIEALLSQDERLRQATENAEQATQRQRQAHKDLHQAEENVRQQRLKIEQSESTLYGGRVRSPKELQDLQNEIAALKRFIVVLEDRQLEAMLAEEETVGAEKSASAELAQVQADFKQQCGKWSDEKNKLIKDVARFENERQAAAAAVPLEDIRLYDQLRQQRRGVAVSKVTDKACAACGSILSAALLSAAHSPNQLTRCETCGRILYVG